MRVIAGEHRGRPLVAPKNAETRPTADLIKGVVFSALEAEAFKRGFEVDEEGWLAAAQAWPNVLDLYAGSGALGIEALSRGARHATLVERDRAAVKAIQANLAKLNLSDRADVRSESVVSAVNRLPGPFDLILADPPYDSAAELASSLTLLVERNLLAENGIVVIELRASSSPTAIPAQFEQILTRRHGRTEIQLLGRRKTPAEQELP